LLRTQKRLILEEETLTNPDRIDAIARNELKMTLIRPNQLILPQTQDVEQGASNIVAMVDSKAANARNAAGIGAMKTNRRD
jgi:cell division protein FtsL